MDIIIAISVIILGLVVGSFLNVCICRLPKESSIMYPPSNCPRCSHRLSFTDLIPVFSYVFLRGKCRYCKGTISVRYPVVEILTSLLFVAVFFKFGIGIDAILHAIFISLLIVIIFTDLETQTIHDYLSFGGIITGILYGLYTGGIISSLIAMVMGGLFFLLVRQMGWFLYKKEAMGEGDVLLATMLGAFFGIEGMVLSIMLSFLLGAVISLVLLGLKIKKRGEEIPFGPFMAVAALIVIFFGPAIWSWYF